MIRHGGLVMPTYNVIERNAFNGADEWVGWSSSLQGAYDIAANRLEAFKAYKDYYTYKIETTGFMEKHPLMEES
tara:strand:- start:189 stop:410 length:222 start_codon:yes stop_codon:yes gene_type:complete